LGTAGRGVFGLLSSIAPPPDQGLGFFFLFQMEMVCKDDCEMTPIHFSRLSDVFLFKLLGFWGVKGTFFK